MYKSATLFVFVIIFFCATHVSAQTEIQLQRVQGTVLPLDSLVTVLGTTPEGIVFTINEGETLYSKVAIFDEIVGVKTICDFRALDSPVPRSDFLREPQMYDDGFYFLSSTEGSANPTSAWKCGWDGKIEMLVSKGSNIPIRLINGSEMSAIPTLLYAPISVSNQKSSSTEVYAVMALSRNGEPVAQGLFHRQTGTASPRWIQVYDLSAENLTEISAGIGSWTDGNTLIVAVNPASERIVVRIKGIERTVILSRTLPSGNFNNPIWIKSNMLGGVDIFHTISNQVRTMYCTVSSCFDPVPSNMTNGKIVGPTRYGEPCFPTSVREATGGNSIPAPLFLICENEKVYTLLPGGKYPDGVTANISELANRYTVNIAGTETFVFRYGDGTIWKAQIPAYEPPMPPPPPPPPAGMVIRIDSDDQKSVHLDRRKK